ncbi:MAG: KpsF/GutQ family sugar-phosphate isomerase [Litorimonas sp.]
MSDALTHARKVIDTEISGLTALSEALDENFTKAVKTILAAQNYLIIVGVGKTGNIGQKIAASFASTGTPSFFMHPTEASHGDLGMVTDQSVILAISNSGESQELRDVLQYTRRNNIPVIAITKNPGSTLAKFSQIVLRLPDAPEACPNGIAPTTSTTNTLAMGDALVVATMVEREFTLEDFGKRHPGGKIGLGLQSVDDWLSMHPKNIPAVKMNSPMDETISVISKGAQGCAAVMDEDKMIGIITDGDLRRAMDERFFEKTAKDIMTNSPLTLDKSMPISQVIEIFTQARISNAFVVENERPLGVIDMKSLLAGGYL